MSDMRIGVTGSGDDERFTVYILFPDPPKHPGHFMTSTKPMTEAEFRTWLRDGGISEELIEQTVIGAREHARQQAQG